uniref:Uncharacterized protein n=1 Tax=Peronospora matthiolae TaxID=2874970 RepID=A0AAV1U0I5_9STRA
MSSITFSKETLSTMESSAEQEEKRMVKSKREELDALEKSEVWRLALRSSNSNVFHSKWVFKTKTTTDINLERHKALLVA